MEKLAKSNNLFLFSNLVETHTIDILIHPHDFASL